MELCSPCKHGDFVKKFVQLQFYYAEYMRAQLNSIGHKYMLYRRCTAFLSTAHYCLTDNHVYKLFPDVDMAQFLLSSQTYYKLAASQRLKYQQLETGCRALHKLHEFLVAQTAGQIIDFEPNLSFITETGKWLSKAEIYGRVAHAAALLNQAVSQFIASRSKRPNRGFNHDLISFLDEMKENFCGYFPDLDAIDVRLNGQLFEKCMSLIASFANCCLDKEGEVVNFVKCMESMAQIGRLIGRCDVEEEIYKIFQSDSVERTAKLRSIRRRMGPS